MKYILALLILTNLSHSEPCKWTCIDGKLVIVDQTGNPPPPPPKTGSGKISDMLKKLSPTCSVDSLPPPPLCY